MVDWSGLPGGFDASHWNGAIDWGAVAAAQPAFVILKASQGTTVDPMFEVNRRACADRKLTWLPYPFLTTADGPAAVRAFMGAAGDKTVPAALDWERAGVSAAVVEMWIDGLPRTPLAYYGFWPPAAVTQKIARCPRWFAQYPGSPTAPPRIPPWDGKTAITDWSKTWLIWQWTQSGQEPGVRGNIDLDRLACSVEVFRRWYETGVLGPAAGDPPHPPPPPLLISRALSRSTSGGDVGILQKELVAAGFVVKIDRDFGPATEAAVRAFQASRGLPVTGVADLERTLPALAHQ
jgi:hypothetical protein